ncbi:hypothetical protein W97_00525 [Coniosporium apollinis CBS 100218]|uniref:Telomere repeat-binding factor dimerisation domain-containing protein n=1 Tax=Coniosporium apollinis (strain CBS 100218) TaxID=1168221 RepID=R7YHC9_CONA1|nr:uncharacterized protein W97_00525 [Coniosporium apollinis CBS 100218]EON61312.1 hypothetical protein W97_00525 [Coniosporium apollinis CBS 100218]
MATSSPAEMIACMTNPRNNEHGTLKSLFEHTKKAFTRDDMMINPNALPPEQPASYDILRRANIVTFLVSIFDSRGPDFVLLNRLFLETFVPLGSRLYKWQGALFLELKTQAYISSMLSGSSNRQDVIDEFFPGNLELCLLMRRPASNQQISPSEQDFLKRVQTRRSYLLSEPDTPGAVTRLLKKYEWKDFLKEIINCAGRYVESSTPSAQTVSKRRPTGQCILQDEVPLHLFMLAKSIGATGFL